MNWYRQAASNLFHDLGSFLVVELQLSDGLVDAHPSDLWAATNRSNDKTCRRRWGLFIFSLNHRRIRSTLHFYPNNDDVQEETPCGGSHHFGQIPHLVLAVLDLPPAVVDLLQQTNGTLFRYFSQQESTPGSWTIWIPPCWHYRCVYKKCALLQDLDHMYIHGHSLFCKCKTFVHKHILCLQMSAACF